MYGSEERIKLKNYKKAKALKHSPKAITKFSIWFTQLWTDILD